VLQNWHVLLWVLVFFWATYSLCFILLVVIGVHAESDLEKIHVIFISR
jgi:hypothetical protein